MAIGGVFNNNDATQKIEAYNIKDNTWTFYDALIFPRRQITAIWISDKEFLVVGGRNVNIESISNAEIFSIETQKLRPIANYPIICNDLVSEYSSENILIVFGGREGGTNSNQSDAVYHYDVPSDTWKQVGIMTIPSEKPATIKLWSGNIVSCGGNNEKYRHVDWLHNVAIKENNTFRLIGLMQTDRHKSFLGQWDSSTLIAVGGFSGKLFGYNTLSSTEWIKLKTGITSLDPNMNHSHSYSTSHSIPIYRNGKLFAVKIVVIAGYTDNNGFTPAVEILEQDIISEQPSLSDGRSDCSSFTFETDDSDAITDVKIDNAQSNNVDMRISPNLPSSHTTVIVTLQDQSKAGKFRIIVTNAAGLTSEKSDVLNRASALSVSSVLLPNFHNSVVVGQSSCADVLLTNQCAETVFVSKLFMGRNIEISLFGGGYSAIIPPKSTLSVKAYFAPHFIGGFRNTLFIDETPCVLQSQPLRLSGIPDSISGKEKCNIGIKGEIISTLLLTKPFPNPAADALRFSVSNEMQSITFFDSYGNERKAIVRANASQMEITAETSELQSGFYVLEGRERWPVFITH